MTSRIKAFIPALIVATLLGGAWVAAQVQVSGGVSVILASVAAPYTVGDIAYANATTTMALLNDVATGNALISGGVGVAPAWGKVALTTHVSGILPAANGGTGIAVTSTASSTGFGTGVAGVIESGSTDWGGRVTIGTGGDTTGTVTFGSTYTTKPHCVGNNETTAAAVKASATTTTLTLTGTFVASNTITWVCR